MRYLSFAKAQNKYPPATTVAMISADDGKTFTPLATILDEQPITVCSHSLKQLASGRIVLPLNRDLSKKGQADHWEAGVAYSDDGGKTWKQSDDWVDAPKRGAMEPHVEEIEATITCSWSMRTQMGSVYQSESRDGGQTWSKATSLGIEAPESCPELCKVPGTGDLLLIWNGVEVRPEVGVALRQAHAALQRHLEGRRQDLVEAPPHRDRRRLGVLQPRRLLHQQGHAASQLLGVQVHRAGATCRTTPST